MTRGTFTEADIAVIDRGVAVIAERTLERLFREWSASEEPPARDVLWLQARAITALQRGVRELLMDQYVPGGDDAA